MEDYILREINKLGLLLEALLQRVGVCRKQQGVEVSAHMARTELAEKLDIDIDELLAREDFIDCLRDRYHFSDEDLEQFAELLVDFAAAAPTRDERLRLAAHVSAVYNYLDSKHVPASLGRYYVLQTLDELCQQ